MNRAVILAGGRGTRLHPFTITLPKPLVPIGDRPILEIVIGQLIDSGFSHVTLAVNHQADILRAYFGDGGRWNIKIDYSMEHKPLSTMAPLRLIPDLPDDFLVMNGDILTDLNFGNLLKEHTRDKQLFTIGAAARVQQIDYGVLEVGAGGFLAGFKEKPAVDYCVSMGVYCVNKNVLSLIPEDQSFGFDQLMSKMIASNQPVRVAIHKGYWLDIGRPDDYQKALEDWPALQTRLKG